MRYRGNGPLSKLEYGAYLAASLHYLMVKQRDATGLITFDEQIRTIMSPKSTTAYVRQILARLQAVVDEDPGGKRTSAAAVLSEVAERIARRSLVVIVTDQIGRAHV